jgi:hypothetical protein
VGLIQTASDERGDADGLAADQRSAGRLAVAMAAYLAGFYLVDVIEVDARTGVTARDVARLSSLVVRIDAEGVFVLGVDDDGRAVLGPMADELRLVVRVVAGGDGEDSSPGRPGGPGPGPERGSAAEGVPAVDLADRMPEVGSRAEAVAGRGARGSLPGRRPEGDTA